MSAMPPPPDDRDALARESRRVRSALDDLADLAALAGPRSRRRPPPRPVVPPPPPIADDPDPVPGVAGFFDDPAPARNQTPPARPASPAAAVRPPAAVPPASSGGEIDWFNDPVAPPLLPTDNSVSEIDIVTPDSHETRITPPRPPSDSPTGRPTDDPIDEVLDGFDW